MAPFARQSSPTLFAIGNDTFELAIGLGDDALPYLARLACGGETGMDWTPASAAPLGPVLEIDGQVHAPGAPDLSFEGVTIDGDQAGVVLTWSFTGGLRIEHTIRPDADRAVFRTSTTLTNVSGQEIGGIGRFDAVNLRLGMSQAHPRATYLNGWLDGPRAEAPGHPPVPFDYPAWIYPLLYGHDAAPPPEPPVGGWYCPNFQLVQGERLTRLPLRSGMRSTFDNFPWVAVLDPGREAGIYAGFEWTGRWRMDVEHRVDDSEIALSASMDSYVHTLAADESLCSQEAFVGFFAGDWDEAMNTSRRYVADEIMPTMPDNYPLVTYDLGAFKPEYLDGEELIWRSEADAAADLGVELFFINASWWSAWDDRTDFSYGLGDFTDNREMFRAGLRGVSDHVHELGMRFGLWFEFERVDIRTAHQGRHPWRPEWLVHRNGHPSLSWCPHVYNLCLGVRGAATWAADNISWAIDEYGVDHVMLDGNEWDVCDDATHDHGPGNGDWAQIQGLYHVLRVLRDRFPDLLITNSSAQRGDFGMARHCQIVHPHDIKYPSSVCRKNNVGIGALYPTGHGDAALMHYPDEDSVSPARLESRCISRMMSVFRVLMVLGHMDDASLGALRRTIATQKRIKKSLQGDRYVLAPAEALIEREYDEGGSWEAYQYLSPGRELVSVFAFRCLSPEPVRHLRLRGLDPAAVYTIDFHNDQAAFEASGQQLMDEGVTCRIDTPRHADIAIIERRSDS